jgi:hypothetical protein
MTCCRVRPQVKMVEVMVPSHVHQDLKDCLRLTVDPGDIIEQP